MSERDCGRDPGRAGLHLEPDTDPGWLLEVREVLAAWYRAGHRELPWRSTRDPYAILVSEFMLIQTTVGAVIPYYERFLLRFPTVRDLAESSEEEVLRVWEGLGYYRRARLLHRTAQALLREHGGMVPRSLEELRALPGVGGYLAGAVASFAFDVQAPIVEANTQRVLARLLAWGKPLGSAESRARLWLAAERLVPSEGAGEFNQALMELGAVVCLPREPRCLICPIAAHCHARSVGMTESIPVKAVRPVPLQVKEAAIVVVRGGRLLLLQRRERGLWANFWEFPTIHIAGADPAGRGRATGTRVRSMAAQFRELTGLKVRIEPQATAISFTVTKHRVRLEVAVARDGGGEVRVGAQHQRSAWVDPSELETLPLSAPMRRLARWGVKYISHGC